MLRLCRLRHIRGWLPMTDEQWSTLTARLKVPAPARAPIENELDLYRRVANAATLPPSETRKNLERAAEVAGKLLGLIEGFGPDDHRALVELDESVALSHVSASLTSPDGVAPTRATVVGGSTPRLDALKLLVEQHAQLTVLRDRMATAAARVGRGKTGSDASNTRAFVTRVSEIIETHATGGCRRIVERHAAPVSGSRVLRQTAPPVNR